MNIKDFCPKDCPKYENDYREDLCLHQEACTMWQTLPHVDRREPDENEYYYALSSDLIKRTCENCKWYEKPGLTDPCIPCVNYSNWEEIKISP